MNNDNVRVRKEIYFLVEFISIELYIRTYIFVRLCTVKIFISLLGKYHLNSARYYKNKKFKRNGPFHSNGVLFKDIM